MDTLIVARKLDSLQRCLARVHYKCPTTPELGRGAPGIFGFFRPTRQECQASSSAPCCR
jgi:hypothetical protein